MGHKRMRMVEIGHLVFHRRQISSLEYKMTKKNPVHLHCHLVLSHLFCLVRKKTKMSQEGPDFVSLVGHRMKKRNPKRLQIFFLIPHSFWIERKTKKMNQEHSVF